MDAAAGLISGVSVEQIGVGSRALEAGDDFPFLLSKAVKEQPVGLDMCVSIA